MLQRQRKKVIRTTFSIFLLFSLLCCFSKTQTTLINQKESKNDTLFVTIDSTTINNVENTFEYVLIFKAYNEQYKIHSELVQDYNLEFKYAGLYKKDNLNFVQFNIYGLATGLCRSTIRNKESDIFFLTEWYDTHASGDSIIKSSVNFNTLKVTIKSLDKKYPDYQVKLKKIWEPTIEYKNKTRIKT